MSSFHGDGDIAMHYNIIAVTNPVRGLPSAHHQRSPSDYIDSHTTQTSTCHHGLLFPCLISLFTFTPAAYNTLYLNQSLTTIQC